MVLRLSLELINPLGPIIAATLSLLTGETARGKAEV